MGLFDKRSEPAPEPAALLVGPQPGDPHLNSAVFREGFYYPILLDAKGNELGPDNAHPLVWDDDSGCLRYAHPTDANHFHTYGLSPVEVQPIPEGDS